MSHDKWNVEGAGGPMTRWRSGDDRSGGLADFFERSAAADLRIALEAGSHFRIFRSAAAAVDPPVSKYSRRKARWKTPVGETGVTRGILRLVAGWFGGPP
jgi:hypothetical protein